MELFYALLKKKKEKKRIRPRLHVIRRLREFEASNVICMEGLSTLITMKKNSLLKVTAQVPIYIYIY